MKAVADKSHHAEQRRESLNHFAKRAAMRNALFESPEKVSSEVEPDRPYAAVQRKLQKLANNSFQVKQLAHLQQMVNHGSHVQRLARTQEMLNSSPRASAQRKQMDVARGEGAPKKENQTGLPDDLKTGIENLSGVSMDGVEAHFNSPKPAQLQALAYTQGRDIYVGPGQERHLPHEAWHVVQQSQGRVQPTMQAAGMPVNDDEGLEHEADEMGAKALQMTHTNRAETGASSQRAYGGQSLGRMPVSQLLPVQLMTAEDLRFLFNKKMGLRHLSSLASAEDERIRGTVGGDAVPLNPLGQTHDPFPLMGIRPLTQEVIDAFVTNMEKFIEMSLSRTVKIDVGRSTPHELVNSVFGKSTFLLVEGMTGIDVPKDVEKRDYAGLGKAGKQPIDPRQIAGLATFDATDAEYMHLMHSENWDTPIASPEEGEAIYQDLVFLFSNKIQEAVTILRTRKPPQWYQEVMADLAKLQRPRDYSVPPDFNPDSPETQALLDELAEEEFDLSGVTQMKRSGESATQLGNQSTSSSVVQLMYKGAKDDIEELLEQIRPDNDTNSSDAKAISKETILDSTPKEQVEKVIRAVSLENFQRENEMTPGTNFKAPLLVALENGSAAFANKLLEVINEIALSKTEETNDESFIKPPSFEEVAREAVELHFPEILGRIKQAQDVGVKSGKPLLVMIGEKHDDPYSKLIEAILISKLKVQKLFIEATPQAVAEHIEPYRMKEPDAPERDVIGHRQRFYSYLYQQGATVEGVDVDKESAKEKVEAELGPQPQKEPESSDWKARFMEQYVVRRNVGISTALRKSPGPGVLVVGTTHLPGLASDVELNSSYEVVTITTVLPKEAIGRDIMMYGRELETTKGLKGIGGLVTAAREDLPNFKPEDVPASELFALADKLVFEINMK